MIARWIAASPQQWPPAAIVTIEVEPAAGRTAAQYAEQGATRTRGKVTPTDAVIGGLKATSVTGGTVADGMPASSLLVARGDYIYVIGGLATTQEQIPRAAMVALGKSVVFRDLVESWQSTMLSDPPFEVLNKMTLAPLANMRPSPRPVDPGHVFIVTYNYVARRIDFTLDVQVVPNPKHVDLRTLGQNITAKLGGANIDWGITKGVPRRAISRTFKAAIPGGPELTSRVGLVQINGDDVALLTFIFANPDPAALAAYERSSEEIVRSVQPMKK
ncbi:MAG: hypothetical protein QOF78_207 [Phycisphaerales bacterium]|nr:hypothetical protein [Phycisphaerales bacterium]